MSDEINRRDFIKRAGLSSVGAGLAMSGIGPTGNVLGANDKIRVGVIGTGRQGQGDLRAFARQPDVEIVAVCDVFQPNLEATMRGLQEVMTAQGSQASADPPQTHKDLRGILDRKDIDAIVVATPDHWHALPTVEACEAGKDVYVEKPISTVIEEGKMMVAAARKHNRVVQVGTQQRSGIHFQKAVQAVQDGMIGKVSFVRTWNYENEFPQGIGHPADSDPPPTL
ncbi:MAG: gfo/Idh/MocA family oxidoreductase, partial [Acidobacteria bacterium]